MMCTLIQLLLTLAFIVVAPVFGGIFIAVTLYSMESTMERLDRWQNNRIRRTK